MRGCYLQFLLLLLVLLSCNATKLGSSFDLHTDSKVRCIEEERQALLQFKQHLIDHFHWLSSWDGGTKDCCKWEGIKCRNKTGHVVKLDLRADWLYGAESATKYLEGEISSSLLGLQYLTYLDLSYNDFSGKSFPNFVGSLAKLQHLNLSYIQIAGTIPQQLGNSSRLISLDLSWNYDLMEAHNLDWLTHFSSLTYLDMSGVNLSQVVNWPNKVMMLPSLTHLSLDDCSLSTTTPQLLSINASSSSQLQFLDLSYSYDLTEDYNLDWLIHLSSLTHLDMGGVNLSQVVNWPNKVMILPSLTHLSLSYCSLSTTTSQLLSINVNSSSQLQFLDLSENYDLIEAHNLDWLTHFPSLTYLDMSEVNLSQVVNWPNKVMMLPSLIHLSLRYCSLSTTIPELLSINASSSSQLQHLDLSENYDLTEAHNLDWLIHLSSLTYLDMSGVNLSQVVYWPNKVMMLPSLTHLSLHDCSLSITTPELLSINASSSSQLQHLDLSGNYDLTEAHNLDWLIHLSSLTYLDMSRVNLSQVVNWPNKVVMLPSLTHLSLHDCSLSITTPELLSINASSSSQLQHLDLSGNYDLTEAHNLDWLIHLSSLTYLDMSRVNLSQVVNWPNKVVMLPSLTHLSLYGCSLSTTTPQLLSINASSSSQLQFLDLSRNHLDCSIFHLLFNSTTSLVDLDLSYNELQCSIPDAFGSISSLRTLYLSENKLVGNIPKSLMNLCSLDSLALSDNSLSGNLYEFMSNASGCLMDSLQSFVISYNRFIGSLPESIGNLSNLQILDVSKNFFTGVITEALFSNLNQLKDLNLGSNSFILRFSYNWVPPFQLDQIYLSSCKLGSAFPKWLQSQKNYYVLDISNAGISDIIPAWFWDFPSKLSYLYMENNQLYGNLPDLSSSRLGELTVIDLSANLFDGSIPPFPSNVMSLDLSNNRFSGHVSFPCELNTPTLLESLNLSNNTLSGELRDCCTYIRELVVLNLANNNFYGKIPDSIGSLASIELLHLTNNRFVGKIPTSLQNCSKLITIDLGGNNLSGMIPPWIGDSLPNLVIPDIRSNQLSGSLPLSLCLLPHIQILDLSLNQIEGPIPKCIYNLTAMSVSNNESHIFTVGSRRLYMDHAISLVWKGRELVFESSLGLLNMIDLSSNKLHGEVPNGITNLIGLKSLNLSRNNLTGLIPQKIGLLGNLESLDLSRNQLCGEIPISISNISFLSQLDLSTNNLSGKIPTGTQIQGFNASAFLGNPKLCGSPLPNKCLEDLTLHKNLTIQENDDDGFITKGFYVAATLGFIGGFWGVCFISILNIRYIMKRLTSNA